jgi:hypothetical protein
MSPPSICRAVSRPDFTAVGPRTGVSPAESPRLPTGDSDAGRAPGGPILLSRASGPGWPVRNALDVVLGIQSSFHGGHVER